MKATLYVVNCFYDNERKLFGLPKDRSTDRQTNIPKQITPLFRRWALGKGKTTLEECRGMSEGRPRVCGG